MNELQSSPAGSLLSDPASPSAPAEAIPAEGTSLETVSAIPIKKEPYIGSVRFFKNLILLVVLILIIVPSGLAAVQQHQLRIAERTAEELRAQIEDLSLSLEEAIAAHKQQPEPAPSAPSENEPNPPSQSAIGEAPAYQALYPDFYADKPLTGNLRTEDVIYLTFDDGPSDRTPEILQILRAEDVKATFFVVGNDTEQGRQWMRDIVADGHTIAMHTYSHNYSKIYASVEDYLADMYQIFCLIKDATGETPSLFRFPGGSINGYNYGIYQELTSEMLRRGFLPCDWNISSQDAAGGSHTAEELINNVVIQAASVTRGVVLMHDAETKKATVAALPAMIHQLREKGFAFDRLTSETKPVLYGYRD